MPQNDPAVDIKTIKADIGNLRDDISSMTATAMRDGVKSLRNASNLANDKVASAVGQVHDFVEERPMTSLLIAFGAGFVAAYLLRRK
jgi:ElaB/YqjD/DUF883 family membrane-anchored ribosome-binding protein